MHGGASLKQALEKQLKEGKIMMNYGVDVKYPVAVSVAWADKGRGSMKVSCKISDRYSSIIEMLLAAIRGDEAAAKACEVLVEAGLSEGVRQSEIRFGRGEGLDAEGNDPEDREVTEETLAGVSILPAIVDKTGGGKGEAKAAKPKGKGRAKAEKKMLAV